MSVVVSRTCDGHCLDGPEMPRHTRYEVGKVCLEAGLLPFGRNAPMATKEFLRVQHIWRNEGRRRFDRDSTNTMEDLGTGDLHRRGSPSGGRWLFVAPLSFRFVRKWL